MDFVRAFVEASPYARALGVALDALGEDSARLHLPYRDANSNPGKALHGGCAASLAIVGAQALARASLGEGSGPWHTMGLQVNYLAAAIGEGVSAEARLLRRGKALCFVEVDVATEAGKPIAHATTAVRHDMFKTPVLWAVGVVIAQVPFTKHPGFVTMILEEIRDRDFVFV